MNASIVAGSLSDVAQQESKPLAETLMHVKAILIVDTSASMTADDAPGGKSRHDAAADELRSLQESMPGKIGVVAFSSEVKLCPSGIPERFNGSTNMAKALKFVHNFDDTGIKFVVISDGEPDSESKTLQVAKTFKSPISCCYIGPEGGSGRRFLDKLASATGGTHIAAEEIGMLSKPVMQLLLRA